MSQAPKSTLQCPIFVQGERRIRGTAIYPIASSINHECLPNVARVDDFDDRDSYSPLNTAVGRCHAPVQDCAASVLPSWPVWY